MYQLQLYSDDAHRRQVVELWSLVFGKGTRHNKPELSIDKKLAIQDGLFFVALVGDKVVGTILAGYDGHRGWLYAVAVHPDRQHLGIGTALVRHAEKALVNLGCTKINLQVRGAGNDVAAFYASIGYLVEDRISMGKTVDENIQED